MPPPGGSMLLTNAHAGTRHQLTRCDNERRAAQRGGRCEQLVDTSETPCAWKLPSMSM